MPRRTALTHLAPLLLVPVAVTILLLALIGAQASAPPRSCATSPGAGPPTPADTHLDAGQRSVAAQIVAAVRAFGPTSNTPRAAVVALATARQESGIRNLDYGDRDSLGVFQQRPSQGWGTPGQVMDVAHATTSFLRHLVQVPGWQTMRVTDAAATVQRPAEEYRGLYERWVPLATSLTERLWPAASGAIGITTSGQTCGPVVPTSRGSAGYPIPA
ncbi:MAG TPA: hypothetical protein VFI46_16210, partial [Jiangellaceae bacterium]|nr:hypothetical protein [Jiangellaceae bacterium]